MNVGVKEVKMYGKSIVLCLWILKDFFPNVMCTKLKHLTVQ